MALSESNTSRFSLQSNRQDGEDVPHLNCSPPPPPKRCILVIYNSSNTKLLRIQFFLAKIQCSSASCPPSKCPLGQTVLLVQNIRPRSLVLNTRRQVNSQEFGASSLAPSPTHLPTKSSQSLEIGQLSRNQLPLNQLPTTSNQLHI